MAKNIEIKAITSNYVAVYKAADRMAKYKEILTQKDTYFSCKMGRLKLREIYKEGSELIFYSRSDELSPKASEYFRVPTKNPEIFQEIFSKANGIVGIVEKRRIVFLVGQSRIHLDQVKGLGKFVEIEVVLKPGQTEAEGKQIAKSLMANLNIKTSDLISQSYIDMLNDRYAFA